MGRVGSSEAPPPVRRELGSDDRRARTGVVDCRGMGRRPGGAGDLRRWRRHRGSRHPRMTTAAAAPTVDPAKARARRYARMSRFLYILLAVTALMHVPVTLAVVELATRAGWPSPWLIGLAWGGLGTALFVGRARAGMPDRKRNTILVRLVDIPYFIHWCAWLWTLIPAVVATLAVPAMDLIRGAPLHL